LTKLLDETIAQTIYSKVFLDHVI